MKKTVCVLLVFILFISSAFANSDCFGYMYENKSFTSVLDAINKDTPYDKLSAVYKEAQNAVNDDVATRLRLRMLYCDFINSTDSKKYKNEIKTELDNCYKDLDDLNKTNTLDVIKEALTFLLYGIDYRVTGSMSKGTKSIKIIDDLYTKNKNDEGVMLLYAQRKAEAPAIGGGNTKVALSVLNQLLENIDSKTTAYKYAVYSELALVYQKSDKAKSASYQKMADALYR